MRYILVYEEARDLYSICKKNNNSVDEHYVVFLQDIESKQIAKETLEALNSSERV